MLLMHQTLGLALYIYYLIWSFHTLQCMKQSRSSNSVTLGKTQFLSAVFIEHMLCAGTLLSVAHR